MTPHTQELALPRLGVGAAQDAAYSTRAGLIVIVLAFVAAGGWMALAPIAGAIIAQGAVKIDMNRKTVQHQEGGIVKEILVRDGDRVRQGQPLIVLDDVRVDAAYDSLKTQLDSELARNARLSADRMLANSLVFPEQLTARAEREPKVAEVLQREEALFRARRQTLREQARLLEQQARQAEEEASALRRQIRAQSRALSLQREELAANKRLMDQGFVGAMRVKTVDRAAADYESRLGEQQAELAKAHQRASELALRVKTLENQFMQAAADELKESSNKLFDLEERLRPSKDAAERQRIVAPIAGEIVDLKVTSPGAVVGPRDALLDIVPKDGKLIMEGRIRTEDINFVQVGSEADVRLVAFKSRTTPVVGGKVFYVSADRLIDRASNLAYYTVQVDVPAQALREAGDLKLQAGMPVEIFIKTAERTALEYLLDPVTAYVRRALREP
ncbi:MAG: HlyD family type I secretion periplasmic adaptor subunit [Rhodocyclaceae bacterium]|nr:Type I secretion system membrane fusion protein PrsE [Rhodocyclaceae bacterium]MCL4680245.1 HlyD family type I secretion periplasmic adaptor subunit [Rhodocyclaceae bacterium]